MKVESNISPNGRQSPTSLPLGPCPHPKSSKSKLPRVGVCLWVRKIRGIERGSANASRRKRLVKVALCL